MKNNPLDYLKSGWRVLTEVPGWPDAPLRARFSRSLPILLPVLAIVAIVSWKVGYFTPQAVAEKAQLEPMLSLESEISSLQMMSSLQQLAELNERKAAAARLLVSSSKDLPPLLQELKATAKKAHWDATFQIAELADEPVGTDPLQISYLPVRAKFKPQADNEERFVSLLALLEQFSSSVKRIDLTRVSIRADESRWQAVEVNFRLISPLLDEKTL